jgi:Ras-related protein Rab-7A
MSDRFGKILILGDPGVGKTALFHRITQGLFCEKASPTLGADFTTKTWNVGDKTVSLQIWDTAGQERFRAMGSAFYRGTDACLIVFDLTRRETFQHVIKWKDGLESKIGANRPGDFPLLLIANKSDLQENREVTADEAKTFGKEYGFCYFEVSAKTQENVEMALDEVAKRFLEASKNDVFKVVRPEIGIGEMGKYRGKCC